MDSAKHDTWDVSFPAANEDDIVLWNSARFSELLTDEELTEEFLMSIKSKSYVPIGLSSLPVADQKDDNVLLSNFYEDWYEHWFDEGERWKEMNRSLKALSDKFEKTAEYLPSGGVFSFIRGWSPEGIGHFYGFFKCGSVGRLLERIHKVLIPEELDDEEDLSIVLPTNGTLTLELLKGQCFTAPGVEETDDDGSLIYEYGTTMEFYHVKECACSSFEAWSSSSDAINDYCENYISRYGLDSFKNASLEPINNIVKHVWLGDSLQPKWNIRDKYKLNK